MSPQPSPSKGRKRSPTTSLDPTSSASAPASVRQTTPTHSNSSPNKRLKKSPSSRKNSPTKSASQIAIEAAAQTCTASKPVRVYCDGIYDLFHFGHARALRQAKLSFKHVYLLVGVCNDELTHAKKGKTVMNAEERGESLRHCKWVDEVIENAPWIVDQPFLDKHKIDFVAHDDIPYQSDGVDDVYAFVKDQGKFLATQRTDGISTSDLITRIVRDYDEYVRRNLDRGIPAKDLNVSFFKEKEIQMKKQVQDWTGLIRSRLKEGEDYIKQNWMESRNELIETFDDRSAELRRGFLTLFGSEGAVQKFLRRQKTPDTRTPSPSKSV